MALLFKHLRSTTSVSAILSSHSQALRLCCFHLNQISNHKSYSTLSLHNVTPLPLHCMISQPKQELNRQKFYLTRTQLQALKYFSLQRPDIDKDENGQQWASQDRPSGNGKIADSRKTIPQSEHSEATEEDESKMTVFQKFKKVYKEYGYILMGVHVATSIGWYGAFYALAYSGVDLMPLLVKLGTSEALQAKYAAAGDFLVAYIIYEIAKPVRYLATLGATRQTVFYLRKRGYLKPIAEEDKLRNLARDGRENVKERIKETRENVKEKMQERRDARMEKNSEKGTIRERIQEKRKTWQQKGPSNDGSKEKE